jgi:predicted ATP-grasp superfamily ATP-dependent carboligase
MERRSIGPTDIRLATHVPRSVRALATAAAFALQEGARARKPCVAGGAGQHWEKPEDVVPAARAWHGGCVSSLSETRMTTAVLCGDTNMLRCFVGSHIPTVIVITSGDSPVAHSRYCTRQHLIAPPSEERRAVSDLEALGRLLGGRPPLFYGTDAMLLLISRNRSFLERYFRFRLPPPTLIEDLVDKTRFGDLGRRLRLPIPETLGSEEIRSTADIARSIGLPCLFKPSVHIGWFKARAEHGLSPHKAVLAETAAELERHHAEVRSHSSSFVVQRYVRGGEDQIYSYHAYVGSGSRPLGEFTGRKLRTYPKHAGVSTLLTLVKDTEVIELGRDIVRRLDLVGPVKIDFKRDSVSGRTFLLEVNARFTLWNHLGAANGVNLPLIAYRDLMGEPAETPRDFATDVRWLSFGNDLRAYLRDYRPQGKLPLLAWLSSLKGPMIYDIFAWDDPLPFAKNAELFSRAFFQRLRGVHRSTS